MTGAVYIDLSKAFDVIDHSLLLDKLERMGVRGVCKNWISDYLKDREFCVKLENVTSKKEPCEYRMSAR